jgi:hypothetical protein
MPSRLDTGLGNEGREQVKQRDAGLWDAFSDVDAFINAELAAMAADGTRSTRSGPKPPLTGAAPRKAILYVAFYNMKWRAIRQLCDIPFSTLYTLFARWIRL